MAKFRKKPVVVEALQLLWSTWQEMCDFAGVGTLGDGKPEGCYVMPNGGVTKTCGPDYKLGLHIPTLEGLMLAVEGDWIIRGVSNELYPCKPDIFQKTYEAVEPSSTLQDIEAKAQRAKKLLRVSPGQFRRFAEDINAKIELDDRGEYITLNVYGGELRLEPNAIALPPPGVEPRSGG